VSDFSKKQAHKKVAPGSPVVRQAFVGILHNVLEIAKLRRARAAENAAVFRRLKQQENEKNISCGWFAHFPGKQKRPSGEKH
jgi:hypothetical protein